MDKELAARLAKALAGAAWHRWRSGMFPVEPLADRAGRSIAWSPDGSRIGAGPGAPEDLHDRGRTDGDDPHRAVVEGLRAADAMLGRGGFGPTGS
jgi:hypothetical protein